jgi:hypothetical protein
MSLKNKLIFAIKSLLLLISCDQNKPRLNYNMSLDINKEYYVVLMAGQSNMVGLGDVKYLENRNLPENTIYFNHSTNTRLKKLLNHKFGPEVGLAKRLNEEFPHLNFIFIKYAIGGSSINDWLPHVESKIKRDVDFGDLYGEFFNMTDSITAKYNTKPLAFLWMQGETDARYKNTSNSYEDNLKSLINKIREDFDSPNLPIIYGKVNPNTDGHNYVSNIQFAQEKIKNTIPNTYLIDTEHLDKLTDKVHYSSSGLLNLGEDFGIVLSKVLKEESDNKGLK